MGSVFVVEQISTGRERALKLLAPGLAESADVRERFVREARAASAIDSDHVVEIVSSGVDEATGTPYLVMELLRGEDLSDRIENSGPMAAKEVADVLGQVCHALDIAHRQGIVHRDLKPENLFLANSRRGDGTMCAKILDFGVAKLINGDSGAAGTLPVGSPGYMAPEQTDAFGKITPAADVWSLGLVAFYLMTGRSYWRGGLGASVPALLREVCFDPIDAPSVRAAELDVQFKFPAGFDDWFCRCVDRNIEARFPDAGSAARALSALFPSERANAETLLFGGANAPQGGESSRQSSQAGLTLSPRADDAGRSRVGRLATKAFRAGGIVAAFGVVAGGVGGLAAFGLVGRSQIAAPDAEPFANDPASSASTSAITAEPLAPPPPPPPVGASAANPKSAKPQTQRSAGPATRPNPISGACGLDTIAHERGPGGPFCLDRFEVTAREYLDCVSKRSCPALGGVSLTPGQPSKFSVHYSALCNVGDPELPVNCVAFGAAQQYCAAVGKTLPTEAQWETAARGAGNTKFAWGSEPPDERRINACGSACRSWGYGEGIFVPTLFEATDGFGWLAPVGSFPLGASPAGELDLFGNVAEWVTDESGEPVARGGSFLSGTIDSLTEQLKLPPESTSHLVGFRCAKKR